MPKYNIWVIVEREDKNEEYQDIFTEKHSRVNSRSMAIQIAEWLVDKRGE